MSDQNTLILYYDYVSTRTLHFINFSKHSIFVFNMYTHAFLGKSLIKVTKYITLPIDVDLIRLLMHECTISKGLVVHLSHCCIILPYIVYFQCTLHKPSKMWIREFCQGSYNPPYFKMHDTLHVQIPKPAVPKLKCIVFCQQLHQVGQFCFVYFGEIYLVEVTFT